MSWDMPGNNSELGSHVCLKLIDLVRQHVVLYATTARYAEPRRRRSRRNRYETNQIWEDISKEVGLSADDCKRRWKGLKDVYAKIRKRRLQENVIGRIGPQRKWLYEDAMSFIKFPFEDTYVSVRRKSKETERDNWTTFNLDDDNSSNGSQEPAILVTDHLSLIEDGIADGTIEYLEQDVVDMLGYEEQDLAVGDSVGNASHVTSSYNNFHDRISLSQSSQPRFRAILPKSYGQSSSTPSEKMQERRTQDANHVPALTNVAGTDSLNAQLIVATPALLTRNNATVTTRNPLMNRKRIVQCFDSNFNPGGLPLVSKNVRGSLTSDPLEFIPSGKGNEKQYLPNKTGPNTTESFFASIAEAVINLPMRAQAEIKMAICKLVTRAEIQYSDALVDSVLITRHSGHRNG